MFEKSKLKRITDILWELPADSQKGMRVPGRVYASEQLLEEICRDRSLSQLANVAVLPGIQSYALVMPDAHEGYGFPIGGVAAFDLSSGIISPGGVGYDINCGIRLLVSELGPEALQGKEKQLGYAIQREVPSGLGQGGRVRLADHDMERVLEHGAEAVVKMGYGKREDLEYCESGGSLEEADSTYVSERAKKRGRTQLGTLGAGNHFIDIGIVKEIYNKKTAQQWGLFNDQLVAMIHTGSRGLGHQIATDYVRSILQSQTTFGFDIPDRELASAPFDSQEGQSYYAAMCAGANYSWANRQVITAELRDAWETVIGAQGGGLRVLYDVAHNIAKVEEHLVDGAQKEVIVHRKGATRAFPGQPVIIPGSMGTSSYVLVGKEGAMKKTFGSSCHGAGRRMSRSQAKREVQGEVLKRELEKEGIIVIGGSYGGIAEESPQAYKDVDAVVDVVDKAGIAGKVARIEPVVVVKG